MAQRADLSTLDGAQHVDAGLDYNPFIPPHRDNPFPFYDRSRREAPVAWSSVLQTWVVSRHDDILAILDDPRRFSSRNAIPDLWQNPPEVVEILREGCRPNASTVVNADPPDHTRMRKVLNRAFSSRRINAMVPAVRRIADELIDAFSSAGSADLIAGYADPIPRIVISRLLGIPREDMARVDAWTNDLVTLWTPVAPLPAKIAAARGMVEYEKYLQAMIDARRQSPRDDILSDLIHGHGDDLEPLTEGELVYFFRGVRLAGQDTTTGLIGNALLNLLRDRSLWDGVCQDRSRIPAIIEESMRRDAPHRGLMRITTEEVEIGGVRLPAQTPLLLLFGSANRDPERFPEPDRFITARPNVSDHVAFGKGVHFCSGAHIARVEARIAIEALAERLPGLRLEAEYTPTYIPSQLFLVPERLPVTW